MTTNPLEKDNEYYEYVFPGEVCEMEEPEVGMVPHERKSKSMKKHEKRLVFRERKRLRRPEERKNQREKQRAHRKDLLENMTLEERRKFIQIEYNKPERIKAHLNDALTSPLQIYINCRFDDIMNEKELGSLAKQISCSYHFMRTSEVPVQFHFLFSSKDCELFSYCKNYDIDNWKVHCHFDDDYWEVLPSENCIVLSPDADEELSTVPHNAAFVIGGLVDRSVNKCETLIQATHAGFKTLRLPVKSHIPEAHNCVLNVNTCVEILIRFVQLDSWGAALTQSVPQRKWNAIGRKARRRLKWAAEADGA